MTEEEIKEYKHLVAFSGSSNGAANFVDWLNVHHFDYQDLIPIGLAKDAKGFQILIHWLWFEIFIETKDNNIYYG